MAHALGKMAHGNGAMASRSSSSQTPPEDVREAMTKAVSNLNSVLEAASDERQKRDEILFFVMDFSMTHPFADANRRVACIRADLLAIREDLPTLYRAVELVQQERDLTPPYTVLKRYGE